MKPGWKTTEFWTTAISQLFALLVMLGVLTGGDAKQLEDALVKCVTAVGALAANALVIFRYIDGRIRLKSQQPPKPGVMAGLALLAVLCLGGAAAAQEGPPPRLLPWRGDIERRLHGLERPRPPRIDEYRLLRPDEADALRRRIAELELELHKHRIGYYAPPRQELPVPGAPKQELPIPGAPKQELPGPGAPRQELPAPGAPKQDLPGPGTPKQELPGRPAAPAGAPQGYQRFTLRLPPRVLTADVASSCGERQA